MNHTIEINPLLAKQIDREYPKFVIDRIDWSKIEAAQVRGFYLDAIHLTEKIITDCLYSYFRTGLGSDREFDNLIAMVKFWHAASPERRKSPALSQLVADTIEWQLSIDRLMQSIATAEMSADSALETAKCLSLDGERIALEISQWCRRHIEGYSRQSASKIEFFSI
jgi:hypothetical protein